MGRILALIAAAVLLLVLLWTGIGFLSGDGANPRAPVRAIGGVAPEVSMPEVVSEVVEADSIVERLQLEPTPREAPASDPAATTGALVILCVGRDDAPVPGVPVFVASGSRLSLDTQEAVADDEGRARFDELQPGEVSIWSHHNAAAKAEVVAGEEREVRLVFRSGVPVRGTVVDARQRPVAGAEVWMVAWSRDWKATSLVAGTGADGSFEVPYVSVDRSLGATASGHGPSELTDLDLVDVTRPPVELTLQLSSDGGDLRGRVLDPDGQPLAGARVAVGESPRSHSMRRDGTDEEQWTARVAVSGPDGSYGLQGLAAGTRPVHVRAEEHPILSTQAEIFAGETSTFDLQLERGMRVTGVVRDQDWQTVDRAIVLALDAPFDDPFPTQGPTETGVPFRTPAARSRGDGSFTLEWMPPGEVHLYASKGCTYWEDEEVEYLGMAQETLRGAPGDSLSWEPVLSMGRRIHGQVHYADGKPMGHVFVSAVDPQDRNKRYTEYASKEGRFSIPGLENQAYNVSVQLSDAPPDAEALQQKDVWPSEVELKLYASYSENTLPKGTVRVRIEDEAERITGSARVLMEYGRGSYYSEEKDGVFEVRLPPDRYRPVIYAGDQVVGGGDWFDLGPAQVLDLGTIRTSFAGSLIVHVVRGEDTQRLWVVVESSYARHHQRVELEPDQDSITFEDLCAGACFVRLEGIGVADVRREVTILKDMPTEVTLETEQAVIQTIEFTAQTVRGWGKLKIVLTDELGALYKEFETQERWAGELPYETSFRMPIGRFHLAAETSSGLTFQGEIEITSLAERETMSCPLE